MASAAWVMGRRQEVAVFVQQVGQDFRSTRLDAVAAAACIDAYVATLHAGLARYFGERSPACCRASRAVTAVLPRAQDGTPTTLYVARQPATQALPDPGDDGRVTSTG
jgi:hypothetical protein